MSWHTRVLTKGATSLQEELGNGPIKEAGPFAAETPLFSRLEGIKYVEGVFKGTLLEWVAYDDRQAEARKGEATLAVLVTYKAH